MEGSVKRLELLAKFLANRFFRAVPRKGKSENSRVFIGELMVGLGGLEPPTSPLSGGLGDYFRFAESAMAICRQALSAQLESLRD